MTVTSRRSGCKPFKTGILGSSSRAAAFGGLIVIGDPGDTSERQAPVGSERTNGCPMRTAWCRVWVFCASLLVRPSIANAVGAVTSAAPALTVTPGAELAPFTHEDESGDQ